MLSLALFVSLSPVHAQEPGAVQELAGGVPVPPALAALADRPVRFNREIAAALEAVRQVLLDSL